MGRSDFDIDSLLDGVDVKNRIVDAPLILTYNARPVRWAPSEVKRMPRALALWFMNKSMFHLKPEEHDEGIPAEYEYKLCIVGDKSNDQSDLTIEYVRSIKELLNVAKMPSLTRTGADGTPMRRVYIDPRSTGAMSQSDTAHRVEKQAVSMTSKAIVSDAAEKIAEAAQHASEADIVAAVSDLTGVDQSGE